MLRGGPVRPKARACRDAPLLLLLLLLLPPSAPQRPRTP